MPRTKRPAGTTVDKRNGRQAELEVVVAAEPPSPAVELRPDAGGMWAAFWSDEVSAASLPDRSPSNLAVARRWISNVNRYLTLLDEADAEPMVAGSTGQTRMHPAYDLAYRIEASIRFDEAQLGIGPKNRVGLAIDFISERRSLADMNSRYSKEPGADVDEAAAADPRLQLVAAPAAEPEPAAKPKRKPARRRRAAPRSSS